MKTKKKGAVAVLRRNYYEILKVLPNASYETLWIAYETLLKDLESLEPRRPDSEKLLREAITVLSDPDTRKAYDRAMGLNGSVAGRGQAGSGPMAAERVEDPYGEAVGRLVSGDLDGALAGFLNLYRSGEEGVRVVEMIALCHRLAGKPDEAILFYRMAIAADPGNLGNRVYLAELHLEIDDDEEAGRVLEEAVEIGETLIDEGRDTPEDMAALGDAYYLLGETEAAADALAEALEKTTDEERRLELLERLAEVFYEAGFLMDCLETCERVLKLNPLSAEANMILGLTYYNCNLLGPAARHIRRSKALDPSQEDAGLILEEIAKSRAEAGGRTLEERIFTSRASRRHFGMVRWFDDQEGSGIISGADGEPVVLHYLSLLGEPEEIVEGDPVSFGILRHRGEKIAVGVRKIKGVDVLPRPSGNADPAAADSLDSDTSAGLPGQAPTDASDSIQSIAGEGRRVGRVAPPADGARVCGYTEIVFESGSAFLLHSGVDPEVIRNLRPNVLVEFTPLRVEGFDEKGPWLASDPRVLD